MGQHYPENRKKSRRLGAIWVAADIAYYLGLIGGTVACRWFLVRWPFDLLRGSPLRPWSFYVGGFAGSLALGVTLVAVVVLVSRRIFQGVDLASGKTTLTAEDLPADRGA
jgi:hypothetical protein